MKWAIVATGALGMAIAAGCASGKKGSTATQSSPLDSNSAVTDVAPPAAPAVAPTPIPVQTSATPAPSETVTPAPAANGTSYTIKKGDTLYSIARAHYGDGKQYKKIMAANPGLTPTHMKVGQVITLP